MDGLAVRIPDLIEPFEGYRSWSYWVEDGRARLYPLSARFWGHDSSTWEGSWRGWVTAACPRDPFGSSHEAPGEDCSCGFYAMKDPLDVIHHWPPTHFDEGAGACSGLVSGRVALAGKVIEHEKGFRAERARISELIAAPGGIRGTALVAMLLDLPVVGCAGAALGVGAEPAPGLFGRRFRSSGPPRGFPPAA